MKHSGQRSRYNNLATGCIPRVRIPTGARDVHTSSEAHPSSYSRSIRVISQG